MKSSLSVQIALFRYARIPTTAWWMGLLTLILFVGAPIAPAQAAPVQICAGVSVDNDAISDAAAGINACLSNLTSGGSLLLPPGRYLISTEVVIPHSGITLGTTGLVDSQQRCGVVLCATLLGLTSSTRADYMVRTAENVTSTRINHLVIDGRRWEWRQSNFADLQALCNSDRGRGVLLFNATNSTVDFTTIKNTPCKTALAVALAPSTNANIRSSDFSDNGENLGIENIWADGVTVGFLSNSFIENNGFYNNSDVSLVMGGGANTVIRGNSFVQSWQRIFAAVMLTNWSSLQPDRARMEWADFRGLVFESNSISCGAYCDIGIQVGALPWAGNNYANIDRLRTMGATIVNNSIVGQKQLINIAGGGAPDYPVVISWNSLTNDGGAWLNAGLRRSIPSYYINIQNIWSDSFVHIKDNWTSAITAQNWNLAF